MSIFGKDWECGMRAAYFKCTTNGPESSWETEIRLVSSDSRKYWVVLDPFANRLMWFDKDRIGEVEARRAFCNIVGLALCDADIVRWPDANG